MLRKRPADGLDALRRERRHSRGNGIARRAEDLQSDARRPRPRHPPLTSGRGNGGRGSDAESGRAAERHAKVAAAPPVFDTSTRRGGGGVGRGGAGGGASC